jgi:hypothetical protein
MQLWLVARVDPLEGFHAVYNIWHRTFKVEQYSTLNTVLELVSDFVRAAGRLPRFVTSADLEALAQGLQSDDEPYGKCTAILALALEYANRVNRTAGWYPPVAFEIWRSAKRNVPFCTNPNIAAEVLKMPIL